MSIAIVDHALPYYSHNLYDVTFYTHNIHTLLTFSPSMVDSWLSEIRNLHSLPQPLIIGLDVEWRPNFQRNMMNPVAVLQLCIGPRCLIFQILHAPNIPQSLVNFLGNSNHTFVGVGIEEDVEKLVCDYELSVATFVDLRDLAVDKLGDKELKKSGIKTLARRVLDKEIEKPKSISRSKWDNMRLTPAQERLTNDPEAKEHERKEEAHVVKKKKEEADFYITIKVARDEDLAQQIGRDIYFDLVDHDKVKCFRVKMQMLFNHFKEEVSKEFGIPVQFLRFWLWAMRKKHSYRPCRPLTPLEETQTVWQVGRISKKAHNEELNLFLEVELGLDLRPMMPPAKSKDDILLFFKLYDYIKQELRYVGRLFVKDSGKPSDILMKLNEMAGYGREEQIVLHEEIKIEPFVMCEPIDMELSYRENQLDNGDIICFQKASRLPDVPAHLRYLDQHRIAPRLRRQ